MSAVPLLTGYEFLRQARNGTTDVMLTMFMLLTFVAYINVHKKSERYWYLFWISIALDFMVKFWAILVVIIPIGTYTLFQREAKATLSNKHFWRAFLLALLLVIPWHLVVVWLFLTRLGGFRILVPASSSEQAGTSSENGSFLGSWETLRHLLSALDARNIRPKLALVIAFLFLTGLGIVRSRSLFLVDESPIEHIARAAGSAEIDREETIVALALPPDYQDAVVGPAAMLYSERPIEVAWSEEQLAQFTTGGSREIIMAERFVEILSENYSFQLLVSHDSFVYGILQPRTLPSPEN